MVSFPQALIGIHLVIGAAFSSLARPLPSESILRNRKPIKTTLSGMSLKDVEIIRYPKAVFDERRFEIVETIPVEFRRNIMKQIYFSQFTGQVYQLATQNVYAQYLLTSYWMEVGVVKFIFRYALHQCSESENILDTSTDVIKFLRRYFAEKHNYSLKFLTPDLLMFWHQVSVEFSVFGDPNDLHDTSLVNIPFGYWKSYFIDVRASNLERCGYEIC